MYKIQSNGLNINVDDSELIRVLMDELGYSAEGADLLKHRLDSGSPYDDGISTMIVKV